jgi:hypothetical protein
VVVSAGWLRRLTFDRILLTGRPQVFVQKGGRRLTTISTSGDAPDDDYAKGLKGEFDIT